MRKTLTNGRGKRKNVDLVEVYRYIDAGHSVAAAAAHFGISESTLYKRHREREQYYDSSEGFKEIISYLARTGEHPPYCYRKLAGRKRAKRKIDMQAVYDYIDQGHTIQETAKHFKVSVSTLYRRHREQNR